MRLTLERLLAKALNEHRFELVGGVPVAHHLGQLLGAERHGELPGA